MPETHDLVVIEIRGEKAVITLEELRNLFVSLQTAATQTGQVVDAAMAGIAAPIQQIATNTGMAVLQLQELKVQLAGMAGVAGGPEAAAVGVQQIGVAATDAQAKLAAIGTGTPAATTTTGTAQVTDINAITESLRRQIQVAQQLGDPQAVRQAVQTYKDFAGAQGKVAQGFEETERAGGRWNASFSRHISWFVQGTIIYYTMMTVMQAVGDQINALVDDLVTYDRAMGQMRYITGEGTAALDDLTSAALSMGTMFGQLPTEIYPGLVAITQASKDLNEQMIYAADAAKLAFMADQDYGESLNQLIAIERVWNMEASEGQHILDLAAVSTRVAMIPMGEFMDKLEGSGKIAQSAGMSIEEYAALIAAVGEYSDLSESELTTLMERMSARIFQPDLSRRFQKEFGFLDIELFEPGTAQTQRRELTDILDDVMARWDELTASQKQSMAELFASSRQATEFLSFVEAYRHMKDYVDEYKDSTGEANKLTGDLMNTITGQKGAAIAAFADMRHEVALLGDEIFGITGVLRDLGVAWEAMARIVRIARGERPEGLTEEEALRQRLAQVEEALAEARGERGYLAQQMRLARGFAGVPTPGVPTVGGVPVPAMGSPQLAEAWLEQQRVVLQARLSQVAPPGAAGAALEGDPISRIQTATKAFQEARRQLIAKVHGEEQVFLEGMAELRAGEYIPNVDAWVAGLESANNALDLSELSQEQIRQAQADSAAMAWEIYEAYVAQAKELSGGELTTEQLAAIADVTVEAWKDMVVLIRNARGELEIVTGLEAAFLDDTTQALQAEKARFDIQRLGRVQPEQFGQLQQGAWQWQAYLGTVPGYDEEARTFYVVLADNVARPIVTTSTALRYAIEDLTEVEKRQLEGMWNLPAGVTAYVPITSLFYQQQQAAAGPPGGGQMTGPPWTGSRIDTTPVTMAVSNLSGGLNLAADAATAFAELMFYAQNTLQAKQQVVEDSYKRADILHQERYGNVVTGEVDPFRRADILHEERYGTAPVINANINLTSQLYLNQTLLATAMQQVLGANLSNSARGYGTRAGGNAPPIMM